MDIASCYQGGQENASCFCNSDVAAPKSVNQLSPEYMDHPDAWQRLMSLET